MKVFYITLKGGMREVARFMTDYLAAYDYSEFEVKHDFSGYPVIIFTPNFFQDDVDDEIEEIHHNLHFEFITYGFCDQTELNITSSIQYRVNHIKAEFKEFCNSNHCEGCKYNGFGDCKIAFTLDKAVSDDVNC